MDSGVPVVQLIVMLAIAGVMVAAFWKVFEKAGEPGWAALVPIYNAIVLLRIAGKPAWWLVLFMIPAVNAIVGILVAISIAERFGKSTGFGLGLAFLSPIFYPMLGFGSATYRS